MTPRHRQSGSIFRGFAGYTETDTARPRVPTACADASARARQFDAMTDWFWRMGNENAAIASQRAADKYALMADGPSATVSPVAAEPYRPTEPQQPL